MNKDEKRHTKLAIEALRKLRKPYAFEANLYRTGIVSPSLSDMPYIDKAVKEYKRITEAIEFYESKLKETNA